MHQLRGQLRGPHGVRLANCLLALCKANNPNEARPLCPKER
jgi:hypothetical protein